MAQLRELYTRLIEGLRCRLLGREKRLGCSCHEFRVTGSCKHLGLVPASGGRKPERLGSQESRSEDEEKSRKTVQKGTASSSRAAPESPPIAAKRTSTASSQQQYDLSACQDALVIPAGVKKLSGGPVSLLDEMDKGHFGMTFFRAVSEKHGIVRAKVLAVGLPACQPEAQRAISMELEALATLPSHAHILDFLGYTEASGSVDGQLQLQLVFEFFVDTLLDLIKHRATALGTLSVPEMRKYMLDATEGLEVLHQQKFVHRNMCSENVCLSLNTYPQSGNWANAMKNHFKIGAGSSRGKFAALENGGSGQANSKPRMISLAFMKPASSRQNHDNYFEDEESKPQGPVLVAKIANFQHACKAPSPLRSTTRVSAAECTAPEVWLAHESSFAVDIWGAGCILYDMLARGDRALSKLSDPGQVQSVVVSKGFPPKGMMGNSEQKQLDKIMRRCLSFNPNNRPSISALVDELRQVSFEASSLF